MRALELRGIWLPLPHRLSDPLLALAPSRARLCNLPTPPGLRAGQVVLAVRLAGVSDPAGGGGRAPQIGRELIGQVIAPESHPLRGQLAVVAPQAAEIAPSSRPPLLAEFSLIDESRLHPIPAGVEEERCLFAEPYARLCTALSRRPPRPADRILVLARGALGLLAVLCLRLEFGCLEVHAVAETGRERRLALLLGARQVYGGREGPAVAVQAATGARLLRQGRGGHAFSGGFDRVLDCDGSRWSVAQALGVAADGASVDLCAGPGDVPVDLAALVQRGVALRGLGALAAADLRPAFRQALRSLARDEARPAACLVTGRYRLEDYRLLLRAHRRGARFGHLRLVFDLRP